MITGVPRKMKVEKKRRLQEVVGNGKRHMHTGSMRMRQFRIR